MMTSDLTMNHRLRMMSRRRLTLGCGVDGRMIGDFRVLAVDKRLPLRWVDRARRKEKHQVGSHRCLGRRNRRRRYDES